MPRSFASALRSRPLVVAPVPPAARARPERLSAGLAELSALVARQPRIDALCVPELVDENHEGRPHYRTTDARAFAVALARGTGREVAVTKVVAHLESTEAVRAWLDELVRLGLRHAVLVGGSSRYIPYPGPPVAEANALAAPVLAAAGGLVGNIAIPQRTGEAHRMLAKTRAGAAFFTTQLVFDPGTVIELLRKYDRLCEQAALTPATVLVSVAPVADEADTEYVRWLGAELPDRVEQALLESERTGDAGPSVRHAAGVWTAVRDEVERSGLDVPIGVNVEQLAHRHLRMAEALVDALAVELGPPADAGGHAATAGPSLVPGRLT